MADQTDNGSGEHLEGVDHIEAILRQLGTDDVLVAPPALVWSGIEAELEGDTGGRHRGPHRGRLWLMTAAAAVVAVVAVGSIVAVVTDDGDPTVVGTAALSHQPGFDPRGVDSAATARLVRGDDGYELELTDLVLPDLAEDDLELWLIEPDADGNPVDVAPVALISTSPGGTYRLPAGLDPDSHFIVDISIEPRDGDTAHSGQSILRGALESA